VRPTFAGIQRRVEAHLLDYSGDLYGRTLRLEILKRLRPEQRFSGVDALVAQIQHDVAAARSYLAQTR
jgi:riboflavin kinase/FMN adenylyltransferase